MQLRRESYFRVAKLLSRQACVTQRLHQSAQWSDGKDQKFGIFEDVFLNFADYHFVFNRANYYGPVLFKIDVAKLRAYVRANAAIQLSVTKVPPHEWTDEMKAEDKWLARMDDAFLHPRGSSIQHYIKGNCDIVISGTGNEGLPFELVQRVVIEEHPNEATFFNQVSSAFATCLASHDQKVPLARRNCRNAKCKCKDWANVVKAKNVYKYDFGKWAGEYKTA